MRADDWLRFCQAQRRDVTTGEKLSGGETASIQSKDTRQAAKLELPARSDSLEADQKQKASPERVHIRVVSVRKRLCDPDNVAEKYLLDCLRYARLLKDDTAQDISLETAQRKCQKGEEEHTILEVWR